jgi:mannan endo-1,4-beta-mannosidase
MFYRLLQCILWCAFLVFLSSCSRDETVMPPMRTVAPIPANPALILEARELFSRLGEHYGQYTLAGQVDYQEGGRYVTLDYIAKTAQRRPVIVGLDLIDFSPSRQAFGADPGTLIDDAIKMVKEDKLVLTLNWHWNAPMHLLNDDREPWWRAHYANGSEFNLRRALRNPNGAEYRALIRDIDAIAAPLKRLAEENIPVLWRPLHAADGGWFWWGARGSEAFKELWRLMFARLTGEHNLNNLIWVLTSEDADWYPGDDVVDIIGLDAYPNDRMTLLEEEWTRLLKIHNGRKMIALTEFGGVPLIEEMQQAGVYFAYFVSWTDRNRGKLGPMNVAPEHLRKVYHSPAVITLDEWHETSSEQPAGGAAPLEEPPESQAEAGETLEDPTPL